MAERNLLHFTKFDDFQAFCCGEHGYHRLPLNGSYEVIRLKRGNEKPVILYKRDRTDHASVFCDAGHNLVRQYLKYCRKLKERKP